MGRGFCRETSCSSCPHPWSTSASCGQSLAACQQLANRSIVDAGVAWSANTSNAKCAGRSRCIVYSSVAALAQGTRPSPVAANYSCFVQEPNQSASTEASPLFGDELGMKVGEQLSTLAQSNFNDRGDSSVSPTTVYMYTLSNGYACALRGWTNTRAYAKGSLLGSKMWGQKTVLESQSLAHEKQPKRGVRSLRSAISNPT